MIINTKYNIEDKVCFIDDDCQVRFSDIDRINIFVRLRSHNIPKSICIEYEMHCGIKRYEHQVFKSREELLNSL